AVGLSRFNSTRPNVDLPEPDSPTNASVSPRRTASETSLTACTGGFLRWNKPVSLWKCLLTAMLSRIGLSGDAASRISFCDGFMR
nr:hypothetical protein [Tanacetum cinerariifolium]